MDSPIEERGLTVVTSPRSYGLPFDSWWPGQEQAIIDTSEALKRKDVVFLVASTGTGKSGMATALSHQYQAPTILAPTISLEAQYGELTGVEYGMGRRWHPCDYNMDALDCFKMDMCNGVCAYKRHVGRVLNSHPRILNYAQFFAWNTTQGFTTDLLVCDEGHGVENHIQSFCDMWYDREVTWGAEFRHLVFSNAEKVVFMSASMIPALIAECMGIEEDEYEVVEAQNNFEADRNPVWCTPVGYITSNRPLTDRLVARIDNHIAGTPFNGIVHCSSDNQALAILEGTRYPELFIYPKGRERAEQFQYFKFCGQQGVKKVLISASAYEGQDFPGDECRWNIICKAPYASLGSEVVRNRRDQRPEIYRLEALQKIQQMCGRGMRSADDWCQNYILDGTVIGLYEKLGHLLNQGFRNSWKGVKG